MAFSDDVFKPFSDFAGGAPDAPKSVGLDSGSQGLLNRSVAQASQPSGYYSGILNQNVGRAQTALGQSNQAAAQENASMGGGINLSPGQMGAIRNAYNSQASRQIGNMVKQNDYKGQMMRADYMNSIAQTMLHQQAQQVSQYGVLTNAFIQQEGARAAAINSLFQTGDTAMGMQMARQKPIAQSQQQQAGMVGGQEVGQGNVNYMGNYNPTQTMDSSGGLY